jgi:hypothetical protein
MLASEHAMRERGRHGVWASAHDESWAPRDLGAVVTMSWVARVA